MKETLYTIPLNDAVNAGDECPFCYIERAVEQDLMDFVLGSGSSYMESDVLRSGDITVNLTEGRVMLRGENVDFTVAEYRLLCLFLKNKGRVLTRTAILDKLWDGAGNFVDDNTLSVYVRRLREKLEDNPSMPEHLKTVRGVGYKWE